MVKVIPTYPNIYLSIYTYLVKVHYHAETVMGRKHEVLFPSPFREVVFVHSAVYVQRVYLSKEDMLPVRKKGLLACGIIASEYFQERTLQARRNPYAKVA